MAPSSKLLIKELKEAGDSVRAVHSQRFFKTGPGQYGEGDKFIGVTMPKLRTICKKYRRLSLNDLQSLLDSDIHECRMAAVVIMSDIFKSSPASMQDDLYGLYIRNVWKGRINNWDIIDVSAKHIVGQYLLDKPADLLYEMAVSDSLWARRVSILSTFAFLGNSEATHTIRIAEILLYDPHDLIQKAVGWLLREVGKTAGEKTLLAFLDKYAASMPRTTLRYAIERLDASKRRYYMTTKTPDSISQVRL